MEVDPRRAQLDLAGSLGEKEAAEFVAELWSLMRCGSAAIAGARAEEERDGQAVAREGGRRLFRNNAYVPLTRQERQFTLKNAIKKNAFLTKLYEIHSHQRIDDRVVALAQAFSEGGKTDDLVQRYNNLDYEIRCSMLAAANTQARKNFGYLWSPALVKAGMMTRLWRSITSSKRRQTQVTASARHLAYLLDMPIEAVDDLSVAVCHTITYMLRYDDSGKYNVTT
eukprot:scaffold1771_cov211-Alexandrium_tamarense.AAC.40